MFTCVVCKSLSAPRETATRIVLERRVKLYAKGGGETVEGWEIVREALAHGTCAALTAYNDHEEKGEAFNPITSPGMTDLMVAPETIDKYLATVFEGVHAVEDYSDHEEVATEFEDLTELSRGVGRLEIASPLAGRPTEEAAPPPIDAVPVPAEKLAETFPKPKKQKRAKKVKSGEEAN